MICESFHDIKFQTLTCLRYFQWLDKIGSHECLSVYCVPLLGLRQVYGSKMQVKVYNISSLYGFQTIDSSLPFSHSSAVHCLNTNVDLYL